jgi:hypothetical protein
MFFDDSIFNEVAQEAAKEQIAVEETYVPPYKYRLKFTFGTKLVFLSNGEPSDNDNLVNNAVRVVYRCLPLINDYFFPINSNKISIEAKGVNRPEIICRVDVLDLFSTAKSLAVFLSSIKCIEQLSGFHLEFKQLKVKSYPSDKENVNDQIIHVIDSSTLNIINDARETRYHFQISKMAKACQSLIKRDVDWFKSLERISECNYAEQLLLYYKASSYDNTCEVTENLLSSIHPWLKPSFDNAVLANAGNWLPEASIRFYDIANFNKFDKLDKRTCERHDVGRRVLKWFVRPRVILGYLGIGRSSSEPTANAYAEMLVINVSSAERTIYDSCSDEHLLLKNLERCTNMQIPKSLMHANMLFSVTKEKIKQKNEQIREINDILKELFPKD